MPSLWTQEKREVSSRGKFAMWIRYLGLALAGSLAVGQWIAANKATAQPKHAVGESSTLNLSLEQQNEVQGWYDTLGEYKRRGLAALRHGDCPTVDDYAGSAERVVTLVKDGVGAFGALPTLVRNQIAAEGRRVIKALSVPCDSVIDRRLREAARKAERNSEAAKEKKDDNIGYAISNFFVKLGATLKPLTESQRGSPGRRTAAVDPRAPASASVRQAKTRTGPRGRDAASRVEGYANLADAAYVVLEDLESRRAIDGLRQRALDALRYRQPKEFRAARRNLEALADLYARARSLHPSFEALRYYAQRALNQLPKTFVAGHAYTRDDGTVAADPDWSVRFLLVRDRHSHDSGDGDAD